MRFRRCPAYGSSVRLDLVRYDGRFSRFFLMFRLFFFYCARFGIPPPEWHTRCHARHIFSFPVLWTASFYRFGRVYRTLPGPLRLTANALGRLPEGLVQHHSNRRLFFYEEFFSFGRWQVLRILVFSTLGRPFEFMFAIAWF